MDNDSDSIESIISFIQEKNPDQIKTFLNLQEVKTELKKIEKKLYDELEIDNYGYGHDDIDIEDHPDMQKVQNYIDLLDNPENNYAVSLNNYNAARVNRYTNLQLKSLNTSRNSIVSSIKPERINGGKKRQKSRRTRHRKIRRTRHRKNRRTRHRKK